jgi:hypothetical protein
MNLWTLTREELERAALRIAREQLGLTGELRVSLSSGLWVTVLGEHATVDIPADRIAAELAEQERMRVQLDLARARRGHAAMGLGETAFRRYGAPAHPRGFRPLGGRP